MAKQSLATKYRPNGFDQLSAQDSVKDILSKSLGSSTKVNMAYATLEALKSQRTIERVAELRGKKVEEIR